MPFTYRFSWDPAKAASNQAKHSIRINKQWRLCFVFGKDGAEDVEISKHYE